MQAVIVLAHGSRDPLWSLPVEELARQIAAQDSSTSVLCAYLELRQPDLGSAAQQLVAAGARTVRVLPLFFGIGKHAREDLPLRMAELGRAHPAVCFEQLPIAGEDPRLRLLLAQMALENASS